MVHSSEVREMQESKYQQPEIVERTRAKRLKSSVKADQERNKRVDSIILRLPSGVSDILKGYVVTLPEYQRRVMRTIDGRKVEKIEPNVNQWINDLIKRCLPPDLSDQIDQLENTAKK